MTTFSKPIALPNLKTLHTKPSWHNRAGRVDRSACFVITASQLWRHIPENDWTYRLGSSPTAPRSFSSTPQASCPKPHHFGKTDRHATITLWARDLWELHRWEQPYPLQGDFRTAKTNALRHTPRPIDQRGDRPCAQQMRQDNILGTGPTNPNRGVGFKLHKMLGLDCMWQTTLRIERIIQHHNLKQHFLICPVCSGGTGFQPVISQHNHDRQDACPTKKKPSLPKLPLGRVTKLYLPLCTPQEYNDAQLAQHWLKSHPRNITHPNRPYTPEENQLINRYIELFDASTGRQLRCRQCLGLRYGEKKPPRHHAGAMPHPSTKRKRVTVSTTDSNHSLTRRARTSQAPQPPGHARADQSSRLHQDHPTARVVTRRLPEQQLFLNNLPKLLAPVPDASPPPSPQRRRLAESNRVDTLPAEVKEKLYLLFAGNLPAFQKLQQVKQKSEHEA